MCGRMDFFLLFSFDSSEIVCSFVLAVVMFVLL